MAAADFKINSSVQADRGYDATTSEAITLQLENAPSVDVYRVEFSVVEQSKDAPAITLSPSNGQPSTPGGTVTFTMPSSGFHSYLIRCKVNNGKRRTERGEVVDADFTQERVIAIRGALTSVRKTVPGERTQYHEDGWSYALDEMAEVVESGAVGSPVTSVGASAPIASSGGSTPTISWNPTAAVGMGGYGFTSCTGVANASGAVTVSAGSGNLTLDASAVVKVGPTSATRVELGRSGQTVRHPALAGSGTRFVTVDNNGDEGAAAGSGADATANYVTDSASAVNANDRPAQALPGTLEFIRAGGAAIGATHTASAGSVQTAAYIRRAITGGTSANTGTGVAVEWTVPDGQLTPAVVTVAKERAEWTSLLAGTGSSKLVWATVNSGTLTDWMTLSGAGNLRLHAYTSAGMLLNDGSGNVSSANPALLVNGALSGVSNAVDVTSLSNPILFISTSNIPLGTRRADASTNDVQTVFTLDRLSGGTAANGIGGGVLVNLQDDGDNLVEAGRLDVVLTDVTATSHDAEWRFLAAAAGSLTQAAAINAAGYVTATTGFLGNSIDRATAGTLTIGGTATAISITEDTTVSGTLTKTGTGLTTTRVVGIRGQNTSASTNVVTVQNGYLVVSEGTAWESGSSSSKTVGGGFMTIPATSGTVGYQLRSVIDAGAGSYSLLADYYTNNDPGLGGTARVADTFISAGGNGFRFSTNGQGGVKQNGTAVMLTSGSTNEVQLGTNSTTRHAITSTGSVTQSLDSTATHRRQWGTAGRRYIDHASAVFTSDSSLGYETALTYALPDNCVAEVIAIGNGLNTSTGDAAGYAKRRTVKRWSGGGATTVGSERDLGADNEDVVNWQMRINVSGNNVIIEVESDTAAVKWGIDIEVHITTSTA